MSTEPLSTSPSASISDSSVTPLLLSADEPGYAPQAGRFYRVNSSRMSFRELWRHVRSPAVLIVWLTKLLRLKLPGSINDPNVGSLRPFLVAEGDLETTIPFDILRKFEPVLRELTGLDFGPPVWFEINDTFHHSHAFQAVLLHRDGGAIARIHIRIEGVQTPKTYLFNEFLSALDGGRFLWSSSARAPAFPPPSCRMNWKHKATASQLWVSHRQELDAVIQSGDALVRLHTPEEMIEALESHHQAVRDRHLERGIFSSMQGEDLAQAEALDKAFKEARSGRLRHPEVMAQLERMQNKQTSWTSAILVLIVSIGLFIGAGAGAGGPGGERWSGEVLLMIVGILFVHEAGHYLAMKLFRYRNVRMFFIPFFGAAVSGQHYSAPGWKKVIVSLMGPLPGIFLGGVLGIAGLIKGNDVMVKVGMFAVVLNGFNLLPVLPLDGGRVMHTLLFSRHYSLDVVFRGFAALALIGIGYLLPDRILLYLGIFMLIGIQAAFKIGKIATELRREQAALRGAAPVAGSSVTPSSPPTSLAASTPPTTATPWPGTAPHVVDAGLNAGEQAIPEPVAEAIVDRVKASFPRMKSAKQIASLTLQVYETLATRPPGIAASIGFAFLHAVSFLIALVLLVVLVIPRNLPFWEMYAANAVNPEHVIEPQTITSWTGPEAFRDSSPAPRTESAPARGADRRERGYDTIVATFSTADAARDSFAGIRERSPAHAALALFGQSVFLTLPSSKQSERTTWLTALEGQTGDVFVESGGAFCASLTLTCQASDAGRAESIKQELSEFLELPAAFWLIPPWAEAGIDRRSEDERTRHQLARATYRKLSRVSIYDAPETKALNDEIARAARRSDQREHQRLLRRQSEIQGQLRLRKLERIRDGEDGPVDRELAERYIAIQKAEQEEQAKQEALIAASSPGTSAPASVPAHAKTNRKDLDGELEDEGEGILYRIYGRERAALGPLMGQLPLGSGGRPESSRVVAYSQRYGYVQLAPPKKLVINMTFEDTFIGAPALIKWLEAQGCRDFKYNLEQQRGYEVDEDE